MMIWDNCFRANILSFTLLFLMASSCWFFLAPYTRYKQKYFKYHLKLNMDLMRLVPSEPQWSIFEEIKMRVKQFSHSLCCTVKLRRRRLLLSATTDFPLLLSLWLYSTHCWFIESPGVMLNIPTYILSPSPSDHVRLFLPLARGSSAKSKPWGEELLSKSWTHVAN